MPVCPFRVANSRQSPLTLSSSWACRRAKGSHTRTVPSSLALASLRRSLLNATFQTTLVCPCNVASSRPLGDSCSRIVPSQLPLASSRPSAESVTPRTTLVWPCNVASNRHSPLTLSLSNPSCSPIVPSQPPL